jgi:uncharacterized protein YecT (DUF1311 family)
MARLSLTIILFVAVCNANSFDSTQNKCLSFQSTQEQVECLNAETARWDILLNENYTSILKLLPDIEKEKLRIAQRRWVAFKEMEIEFLNQAFGWNPQTKGTLAKLYRAQFIMDITKSRALALQDYSVSIEDTSK